MQIGKLFDYDITISPSDNMGIKAQIGCVSAVFETTTGLLKALEEFLKDPKGMEKKYNSIQRDTAAEPTQEAPDRGYGQPLPPTTRR